MAEGPADKITQRIKHITTDLKKYVEKRIELMALSIGEQYARMIAESAQKVAGLVFFFGALVFLLIALALYLGALFNSRSLGFVVVSIPFLICGYLFFNLKPRSLTKLLKQQFEAEIIGMFDSNDEEEGEKLLPPESHELLNEKEDDA